jgi:hypothetical protein
MNMILHNNPTAVIRQGNTLSNPLFKDANSRLKTFDFVVSNPPFSFKSWSNGVNIDEEQKEGGRFYGFSSLEKLIAKKRHIKQGAMQKLLQPKEDWVVKTLKEVAKFRRGSFPQPYGLDKWYDDIAGYPFVQVFDVYDNFKLKNETKRRISKEAQEMSVFIEKGSVIITIQGSIGRIAQGHLNIIIC